MANTSTVTITLGQTGQVVRRAGVVIDSDVSESVPAVGSKRSVRDRLGSSVDAVKIDDKRLRGEYGRWNLKTSNCMGDLQLSKEDLRFKIMKRTQKNDPENTVDLRHMLSRRAHSATNNSITFDSLHEPRHARQMEHESRGNPTNMPEQRNERQSMHRPRYDRPSGAESRDDGRREPQSRDDRCCGPESRDDRQRMYEPRDSSRRCMPEPLEVTRVTKLNDVRPRVPGSTNGSMTGQYASKRTSEGPPRMGFVGNSCSSWTLDNIRRKSPDRGFSPQRRRAYEGSRSGAAYDSRDVGKIARPMVPTLDKQSLSVGPRKSLGATPLIAPTPSPGGNMHRCQHPVEHLTVEGFLRSLGLEKFLISFKVEEIDMAALSQMRDQDLKDLGIPMGPRKKILLALLPGIKRKQAR